MLLCLIFLPFETFADMFVKMTFILETFQISVPCFSSLNSMSRCAVWLCIPLRLFVLSLLCCL